MFGSFSRQRRLQQLAKERVARGAAYLDVAEPGWDRSINLTTLRLSSNYHCVIGQLVGGYSWGRAHLGLSRKQAVTHGFNRPDAYERDVLGLSDLPWRYLDAAWSELIAQRQSVRVRAQQQRDAYATYAENIAFSGGYEEGYEDGQRSMLDVPIETVRDITRRLVGGAR